MQSIFIGSRIWIVGPPGAGKTTLSKLIREKLDIPYYELDQYFWELDWVKKDKVLFINDVSKICGTNKWIIDGQYPQALNVIIKNIDTFIWLDINLFTVLYRVFRRSLKRLITQEVLWNGNKEKITHVIGDFFPYIIKTFNSGRAANKTLYGKLLARQINCYHIRSSNELDELVQNLSNNSYSYISSQKL